MTFDSYRDSIIFKSINHHHCDLYHTKNIELAAEDGNLQSNCMSNDHQIDILKINNANFLPVHCLNYLKYANMHVRHIVRKKAAVSLCHHIKSVSSPLQKHTRSSSSSSFFGANMRCAIII